VPRRALEVLYDLVSGHPTNKTGEFLRLPNVSLSDLFKDNAEGFLIEIFRERSVPNFSADDAHYDTVIALDQFSLSLPISAPNAADETGPAASLIHSHGFHSLTLCDL
jgi:hypothetical protein